MKLRPVLVVGLLAAAGVASASYRDVPRKHWAFQEVQWVRGTGLIPDSQGATFQGQKGMSRYQMAQVMSGYMRDYYSKRDSIQAELTDLKQVGAAHAAEMDRLVARQQVVSERIDSGAVPPVVAPKPTRAPAPERTAAAPAPEPSSPSGPTLAERLAAMRERIRSSREGGDARSERERIQSR